jgi:hypothetical protein
MLGSITPLGERGRARRWSRTVALYVVGSVLGGCAVGALSGLTGALVFGIGFDALGLRPTGPVVLAVLAALCLLGVALDLRVAGLRLPTVHRQVNEDWLARYRSWVIGTGFGFQLGFAVLTIVTTASVYVTLAAALLSGSLAVGLLLGGVFGLARALPLLGARNVTTAARLRDQHLRLLRWQPRVHASAVAAQALAAVVATGITVVSTVALGGIA